MKRALVVLFLFGSTAALALPCLAAVAIPVLKPYAAAPLDSLRAQADVARFTKDFPRCEAIIRELLARHPGDGFALREIIQLASDRDDSTFDAKLDGAEGTSIIPGVSLAPADVAFLRGVQGYYRDHNASALRSLDEALRSRPRWGWAHVYRARVLESLAQPESRADSGYRAALEDPLARPIALVSMLRRSAYHAKGIWPPEADRVIRWLHGVPWASKDGSALELERQLDEASPDRAALEALWRRARERMGSEACSVADVMGLWASRSLSPPSALAFLDDREREGLAIRNWRMARARLLLNCGATRAARQSLNGEGHADPLRLRVDLILALDRSGRPEILALADRLSAASLASDDVKAVRRALTALKEEARLSSFLEFQCREDPASALYARFEDVVSKDPRAARDLIDSLDAANAQYPVDTLRRMLREALGDTVAIAELAREGNHYAAGDAWRLADLARANGNLPRARQLWAYGDAREAGEWMPRINVLYRQEAVDGVAGAAAARELLSLAPQYPATAYPASMLLLKNGDEPGTIQYLEERLRSGDAAPELWSQLVFVAGATRRPDLADSFVARAQAFDSRARSTRIAAGWLQLTRGERDRARDVLAPLAKEIPGEEDVTRMLAMLDSSPVEVSSETLPKSDPVVSAIDPRELTATDWILAREAPADTFRAAPFVYLTHRNVYTCSQADQYDVTSRVTVRLRTQEGVDAFRTMRIPFASSDGVPHVLLARTVQPDGTTSNVPASEMVVTANEGASVDVGESRNLVIPMPHLRVGSVVDIVTTDRRKSAYEAWSWSDLLAHDAPCLESVVEVRVRKGMRVVFRSGGGAPQPKVIPMADWETTRWTMGPVPALELEPMADVWLDQVPWVAATSLQSWVAAADLYRKPFWNQIKVDGEVKELAKRCLGRARTPSEKLDSLFRYVSLNINYTALEFGEGRIVPTSAHDVLRKGYGDCKGMAGLLIALCEASGLEAWPVLVPVSGGPPLRDDFVILRWFDHMIVYVPGVEGGVFLDPTSRGGCRGDLPANLAGITALTFGRSEPGRLVRIAPAETSSHGLSMDVDVRPAPESKETRYDVVARLRGELARTVESLLHSSDSLVAQAGVDRVLAFGLPETCRRDHWKLESRDCRALTLSASYRDTSWSGEGNEILLRLRTEVADPLINFPSPRGRQYPVRVDYPYADTVTIRLHGVPNWDPSEEIAAAQVHGKGYDGTFQSERVQRGSESWVEVTQVFQLRDRVFTPEAYQQFHRDWSRFVATVGQPYRYRRHLDAEQLDRLQAYTAQHPEDISFALEAARRILSGDGGGTGTAGAARRKAARSILAPQLGKPEAGAQPYVLLAYAALGEKRFRLADSLVAQARRLDKKDLLALVLHAALSAELGDLPGSLAAQQELQQVTGNESALIASITLLYRLGRFADAKQAEDRYALLVAHPDSTALRQARLYGNLLANRCAEAWESFTALGADSSITHRVLEAELAIHCGSARRAAELYEQLAETIPASSMLCNNLAWAYVKLGENLDRAGDLLQTAALLDPDNSTITNTQAVLELRAGRIQQAQRLLEAALLQDDRPATEVANRYFLGLCDWMAGRRAQARSTWTAIQPHADEEWRKIIRRTLDLAAHGDSPGNAVFGDDTESASVAH